MKPRYCQWEELRYIVALMEAAGGGDYPPVDTGSLITPVVDMFVCACKSACVCVCVYVCVWMCESACVYLFFLPPLMSGCG